MFRLGRLVGTRGPGLYWLIPLGIEQQRKVDLRTLTIDVESQESITKDSVTVKVNAVVWLKIVDPVKSVVSVANYYAASYQVALTSLRNIIGQHYARRGAQGARQDQRGAAARSSTRRPSRGASRSRWSR